MLKERIKGVMSQNTSSVAKMVAVINAPNYPLGFLKPAGSLCLKERNLFHSGDQNISEDTLLNMLPEVKLR